MIWSRRFLVNERAFKLALPLRVRLARVAGLRFAHGLDAQHFGGDVAHGFFRLLLRLRPARAAERVQRRMRLARADVFADEMRLADGNVKLRRLDGVAAGRVFDDETFGFGLPIADCRLPIIRSRRQIFQTEITSDAVLQMHDQIAFLQIREINVERGTRGQRVRRISGGAAAGFCNARKFPRR